ncbi:MAG TPA: class I SAM-dependent methyltransferase [Oxalicibacterium sp.]|nr:class I SAM-dependent methyltransferase [Oxalicibacterium sp.]
MPSHLSTLRELSALCDTELAGTVEPSPALLQLGHALQQAGYRFTTVTPLTHQRVNAREGNKWAKNLTDALGWSRPFREGVLPAQMSQLLHAAGAVIEVPGGWRSTLRASTLGERLFFHSAYPTTDANAVFFGPDTYRFARALEAALRSRASRIRRAADIGCGAGPGAIAVATQCPQAEVLAIDINDAALSLAAVNATLAGTHNVRPCHGDLLKDAEGGFDLIISNPPYLADPGQRAYRDGGGDLGDGLSLAIIDAAIERLAPGGLLLMYTGVAFVDGAAPFLQKAAERLDHAAFRWHHEEIDPDVFGEELDEAAYAKADRIAALWLVGEKPV